jgi:hypothetical protein
MYNMKREKKGGEKMRRKSKRGGREKKRERKKKQQTHTITVQCRSVGVEMRAKISGFSLVAKSRPS